MQSLFGKIDFVRKFTFDFAETVKLLQKMIRKNVYFKWDDEKKDDFNNIETALLKLWCCKVPILVKRNSSILLPSTNP
jgi:hypothetical protein